MIARMARAVLSCVIAAGLVAWAGAVQAQILSGGEGAALETIDVRFMVVDAARVRLELYDPTKRPPRYLPAAVCLDRCAVTALPGRYLLRVSGPWGSDVKTSQRFLDLEESADVTIDPPSTFQRYFGLSLGILGPTLIVSGIMMSFFSSYHTEERVQPWHTIGLSMALTGVVATPVGWVMFGVNGKPAVAIVPR
jgi:hypothetical protein